MNNTLTNEEIARVFAMYLGCDFWLCDNLEGNPVIEKVTSVVISEIEKGDWLGRDDRPGELLLLTPLELISDEDAAEVSEVFFPDGNIYDYLHGMATGKAIVNSIKANRQTNTFYRHARVHDGFEYLKLKGYAVPLFFGINHWANGKTAIELGIAIKK